MPTPQPISPITDPLLTSVNPQIESLTTSGSTSGTDWYVHIQTVDMMYLRHNQYDSATSSTISSPNAISNYLEVAYTVTTSDEIWQDTTFSGELWQPQLLELLTTEGVSGGFGVCGVVNTTVGGTIRRAARKNSAGDILDTTGHCSKTGTVIVDQMPGAYNASFDTSSQVGTNMIQMINKLPAKCSTFITSLVDL